MGKPTVRRLNFLDAGAVTKLTISPEQVPTLVPEAIMAQWMEGDESPYYKLQMIEYPIRANGLVYEESFFESFLGKLNERPIPGSKSGHEMFNGVRPPTDLLLIGGKLEKNGDGTGKVFFKNYIPPRAETDNTAFIRENKSDMVHYSLVTYPEENVSFNEDGTQVIRITKSLFGERNDAVERGTGAMAQVTNSQRQNVVATYVESATLREEEWDSSESEDRWRDHVGVASNEDLPDDGYAKRFAWYDAEDSTNFAAYKLPHWDFRDGEEFINIRAVRNILARLPQTDGIPADARQQIENNMNRYLERFDDNQESNSARGENRRGSMDKQELLKRLNSLRTNGDVTLSEVAEAMGLTDQVMTDDAKAAVKVVNSLKETLGDGDLVESVKALKEDAAKANALERSRKLDAEFGPEKLENGEANLARQYANRFEAAEIEKIKEDPIMQHLMKERADYRSNANEIGVVEPSPEPKKNTGTRIDRL